MHIKQGMEVVFIFECNFAIGPNKTSAPDTLNSHPKTNSSQIHIHILDLNMRECVRVSYNQLRKLKPPGLEST